MQVDSYIESLLKPLGLPYAENQFIPYKDKPVPHPPYIVYVIKNEKTDGSDCRPGGLISVEVAIEFYSDFRDRDTENKIAKILSDNSLDFEKMYTYINSEELHKTTFYISFFYKEDN